MTPLVATRLSRRAGAAGVSQHTGLRPGTPRAAARASRAPLVGPSIARPGARPAADPQHRLRAMRVDSIAYLRIRVSAVA